jgi:hypothetical protein
MRRRDVVLILPAALAVGYSSPVLAQPKSLLLLSSLTKNFPQANTASCAQLQATVKSWESELNIAKQNPTAAGAAILKLLKDSRPKLKKSIADARAALAASNFDLAFSLVGLGLLAVFAFLPVFFAGSTVALAYVAGASLLSGPLVMSFQAYYRPSKLTAPEFVTSYGLDRTAFLTDQVGAGVKGAKLLGNACNAVAGFVLAVEARDSWLNKQRAETTIKQALVDLESIDGAIGELGETDAKAWGDLRFALLTASIKGLTQYINENTGTDCRFPLPVPGPTLYKP